MFHYVLKFVSLFNTSPVIFISDYELQCQDLGTFSSNCDKKSSPSKVFRMYGNVALRSVIPTFFRPESYKIL